MKIDVIIADDEPLARDVISTYLDDIEDINLVGEVSNGVEALDSINNKKPDLIFLDIRMPKMDGVSLLESPKLKHLPFVIFTTAYDEFALKAFELNAIDYLLKPFDKKRFQDTLEKAFDKMKQLRLSDMESQLMNFQSDYAQLMGHHVESKYPAKIIIRDSKRIKHIPVISIEYIKGSGDFIEIHGENKKTLFNRTISSIESKLDPKQFRRVHKSYLINTDKIVEIRSGSNSEYSFHLESGSIIKSGRTYKDKIQDLIKGNI